MRLVSCILPPDNVRTTIPPGRCQSTRLHPPPPNILIASIPRSGTHVAIDLILNNLPAYKRRPLYVELDRILDDPEIVEEIMRTGGYVMKTHYPMTPDHHFPEDATERMKTLASASIVVQVRRDPISVLSSARTFWADLDETSFREGMAQTDRFWKDRVGLCVSSSDLTSIEGCSRFLKCLAKKTGTKLRMNLYSLPPKTHRKRILLQKLCTRIFGKSTPLPICTGIRLGKGSI